MKTLILPILVALNFTASVALAGEGEVSGRYQLLQSQVLLEEGGHSTLVPLLLKIDSATGKTWLYLGDHVKEAAWVLIQD